MRGVLAGLASPCLVKGKKLDPDALKPCLHLLGAKIREHCPEPQAFTTALRAKTLQLDPHFVAGLEAQRFIERTPLRTGVQDHQIDSVDSAPTQFGFHQATS